MIAQLVASQTLNLMPLDIDHVGLTSLPRPLVHGYRRGLSIDIFRGAWAVLWVLHLIDTRRNAPLQIGRILLVTIAENILWFDIDFAEFKPLSSSCSIAIAAFAELGALTNQVPVLDV